MKQDTCESRNVHTLNVSLLNFGFLCARDDPKDRRTTKDTDMVVRRTTTIFMTHLCNLTPFSLLQVRKTKTLDGQPEIVTWLSVGQPFIFP